MEYKVKDNANGVKLRGTWIPNQTKAKSYMANIDRAPFFFMQITELAGLDC